MSALKKAPFICFILLVFAMIAIILIKGVDTSPGSAQSAQAVTMIGESFEK